MPEETPRQAESNSPSSLERMVRGALNHQINSSDEPDAPTGGDEADDLARVLLSEKYSGAFPHPSVLKALNETIADGAERAFRLTEKEQEHRHACDIKLVDAEVRAREAEQKDRRLLIVMAFVFLLVSLIGAFVAIMLGHSGGALISGGGGLVALAGLFGVIKGKGEGKSK